MAQNGNDEKKERTKINLPANYNGQCQGKGGVNYLRTWLSPVQGADVCLEFRYPLFEIPPDADEAIAEAAADAGFDNVDGTKLLVDAVKKYITQADDVAKPVVFTKADWTAEDYDPEKHLAAQTAMEEWRPGQKRVSASAAKIEAAVEKGKVEGAAEVLAKLKALGIEGVQDISLDDLT